MHIGESVVAALVAEGETFVVNAELVHQGGVEIVNGHFIFDDGVAEVIGLAVDESRLETTAGDQCGEAIRVMVSAVGFLDLAVLAEGGASELAAPDNDGIL